MPSRDPATRSSSHVDCRRTPAGGPNARASVGLSRVVSRVDIGDREWPVAIHLDNGFLASPAIMMHALGHVDIATGLERFAFLRVELVAHAKVERAGNHRHVFISGMHARRDLVAGRKLQPNDEW